MGDLNQLSFMDENAHFVKGDILDIGSKDYGNTPDFRKLFPSHNYIGVDKFPGKGVDIVTDLSLDLQSITQQLGREKFNNVICFSVLEHTIEISKVCSNIEELLFINGFLFISVPFCWEYHGFPDDYWRFTPQAVKSLFPNIHFIDDLTRISTSKIGQVKKPDKEFYKIDLSIRAGLAKKRYNMSTAILIKILRLTPLFKEVFDHPYLMPPVLINMVGKRIK